MLIGLFFFGVLNFTCDKKIFCVVTAPKVVASRYMQAAAAKGPMKADRVSLINEAFGQFVHTVFKADFCDISVVVIIIILLLLLS